MIKELLNAIMDKYNGDSALKSALSGGFYFQEAPQDVSSPYGVFYFIGSSQEEVMGGPDDNYHEIEIQINIFDDTDAGNERLLDVMDKIRSAFDWRTFDITGYECLAAEPRGQTGSLFNDNIWQSSIMYEFLLGKKE